MPRTHDKWTQADQDAAMARVAPDCELCGERQADMFDERAGLVCFPCRDSLDEEEAAAEERDWVEDVDDGPRTEQEVYDDRLRRGLGAVRRLNERKQS